MLEGGIGMNLIQEIEPYKFNNRYSPQPPTAESYGLCYGRNSILIRKNADRTFDFPKFREIETENADVYRASVYLFSIGKQTFYLLDEIATLNGFAWSNIIKTMRSKPRHLAFAAATGYQLSNWYGSRKHCGKCGALLHKSEKSRALFCPLCGQKEYPKITPSVIIGVTNDNHLLLANYSGYDKYALLAGFVEIGESFEEAVKREVMEEVGLNVKNICYYKSQPWPLSDNLLAGFFCEVDGSAEIHYNAEELSNAEWMEREHISLGSDYEDGSLTYEMMNQFRKGWRYE
jgi:NAD+ diphosphatase